MIRRLGVALLMAGAITVGAHPFAHAKPQAFHAEVTVSPTSITLGKPVTVTVEARCDDGDSTQMKVKVRPLDFSWGQAVAWKRGKKSAVLQGPIPSGELRKVSFQVVVKKPGAHELAIDVSRLAQGVTSSQTLTVTLQVEN